ncbi:hypothetical protein [Halpernia frigidisoli]|uniref:hypothetical protein n=1 Tax=Halpernia frigidisoli TaxID=1125876 RepID=UPI000B7DC5D7|nr:hypothetical protein [Halpernia frigidisoli]
MLGTLDYKNDEPFDGILIGDKESSVFKNGKLISETFYSENLTRDENSFKKKKNYENGIISTILDQSFSIAENPQTVYEGIYKHGKPYSGYFVSDEDSEFKVINFFENGVPKFQYSNDYLENMDNYAHQSYNIKSTFKDGKIFDGVEFVNNNKQLILKYWKNGELQNFDWDLFAENYFNRIHFELKNDAIEINDLREKKTAVIKIITANNTLTKNLVMDGKITDTKTYSLDKNLTKENSGKVILYSIEDEKIIAKTMDLPDQQMDIDGISDLIYKVYASINADFITTQEIFVKLAQNISNKNLLDDENDRNVLSAVRINSSGKPTDGVLIDNLPDNNYKLQLYKNGKLIKSLEKIDLKEIEKEVRNLEKLY